MNTPTDPHDLHAQLRELTERNLSPAGRYGHVLLMMVAACMGCLVLALLVTEPALPLRTQAAFGTMLLIAACWVGYSAWARFHRRPLLHAHRVVAGYLATAFSGLFAVAALTAAAITGATAAWLAGGMGAVLLAVAIAMLLRAHRQRGVLLRRRDELERALGEA